MKVICDNSGYIYHQMMDTAQDPQGELKFLQIEVPPGKILVRFDTTDGTAKPVFIDRPLTRDEKLEELEKEVTNNQLALAELLEGQSQK